MTRTLNGCALRHRTVPPTAVTPFGSHRKCLTGPTNLVDNSSPVRCKGRARRNYVDFMSEFKSVLVGGGPTRRYGAGREDCILAVIGWSLELDFRLNMEVLRLCHTFTHSRTATRESFTSA